MTIEFQAWPKIARLNRDITITEKIDGTNAAVGIAYFHEADTAEESDRYALVETPGQAYLVYAQSRKRIITPDDDNFGFAAWVHENAAALAYTLEPGLHFGEWWGKGIQRGYGLDEKRFSLFNTKRWGDEAADLANAVPGLRVVPVLYEGPFSAFAIGHALDELRDYGSQTSPGFMSPEGVIIYHQSANAMFKVTLKDDEAPKSVAA